MIESLGAFSKSTAAWTAGNGNSGLDGGSVAASSWYHVFVIERTDTGVTDILLLRSVPAPALPANYTKKRGVGSIRTNASSRASHACPPMAKT